jgi:hypothetical protein
MENGESDEIIQPDDSYAAQFLLSWYLTNLISILLWFVKKSDPCSEK